MMTAVFQIDRSSQLTIFRSKMEVKEIDMVVAVHFMKKDGTPQGSGRFLGSVCHRYEQGLRKKKPLRSAKVNKEEEERKIQKMIKSL